MTKKVICPMALLGNCNADEDDCDHSVPHEENEYCIGPNCSRIDMVIDCIEIEVPDGP